jgi:hypothetical protein
MDILKAASYGWDKKSAIKMVLRNLTPEEFRKHSCLDDHLAEQPSTMIYYVRTRKRITRDNEIEGIGIHHGHGELSDYVSLDTSPTFKKRKGYREFVLKMAEHLGAGKKGVFFFDEPEIWDDISGNLWNGAKMIGHKEIADLAVYFHNEFVSKHKKGAKTRIFTAYENLTLKEILRMKYNPRKVIEFSIDEIP